MYSNSNLKRTVTAALGAALFSFAVVGAAVGPIPASALVSQSASTQPSTV